MAVRSLRRYAGLGLLTTTMLCGSGAALAQNTPGTPATPAEESASDTDIVVTATRRAENLQDVPLAITALGTQQLDQQGVTGFDGYARLVPSLSYRTSGPGFSNVYFRGVSSGENSNHSASLPSVGTYLDEQPITTITGALDLHIYDIARVEALAGPQGTLYGASSQAGTVRLITNQPDLASTYGEIRGELNAVAHGDFGGNIEGFINAPLASNVALRVVGWYQHDSGYIDNIPGSLTFPSSGITMTNDDLVEDDYNDVDTYGARAALRIELGDRWTVTPTIMGQRQRSNGSFSQERGLGPLQVRQFNPEFANDRWFQAALTVQGRIGNWDLTYAGSYMRRRVDGAQDYSDYAYFYDALAGYGAYFYDNNNNLVNPNQYIEFTDRYRKLSQELRITSPADQPVRLVAGLFYQRQQHGIEQNYIIDNIADAITVPGTESNIWLTKQRRVDRDYAIFGELSWDITPDLTLTGGGRLYRFDNTLTGFFGYSDGFSGSTGVAACFGPPSVPGSPCQNLGTVGPNGIGPKRSEDTGFIHRLNLTYRITEDHLIYATWSRGFRPGGVNRRGTLPPYNADFVSNYELGLKTDWLAHRLRINLAVYQLDWSDIQLSFLGPNGLTEIQNAGNARIRGAELDVLARPTEGLTMSFGAAYNHAETTNAILAPAGTRLPITARFKGNARIRYEFPVSEGWEGHFQASGAYEGRRTRDLRADEAAIYGAMPGYATVDLTAGLEHRDWSIELFARNLFDERGITGRSIQCNELVCGDQLGQTAIGPKIYSFVTTPRTIGLRIGRRF
ncbi:MAG TPA: TonB-dependent receptor [Allosphingosinicella sp.]|nr:TonB-dependent receptor [Allosphingosinicella sp.]